MKDKPPGYPKISFPWGPYKVQYGDILNDVKELGDHCLYSQDFVHNNETLYFTIMGIAGCKD